MSWSPGGDTGEEPPPSYQEKGDMKDQFQQQQEKIAELKVLLKQNEEKLMNKEKEVEVNKNMFVYDIWGFQGSVVLFWAVTL